jgi:hypothetical protein
MNRHKFYGADPYRKNAAADMNKELAGKSPPNMSAVWDTNFAFIKRENRGHLLIGESGIRDSSSYGGKAKTWFTTLLSAVCAIVKSENTGLVALGESL